MIRVDVVLIIFLQWIYMFSSQMYMPLFLDYMPAKKCTDEGNDTMFCYEVEKECNRCIGNCTQSICDDKACVDEITAHRPFHSAAEDYGHYCEPRYQAFRTENVQYSGLFIGSILFGTLSDIWGRKRILVIGMIPGILCMLASGEVPNFFAFYVFRFLVGVFNGCSMVVGWCYIAELSAPGKRMNLRAYATYPTARAIITLICFLTGGWVWANRILSILCAAVVPMIVFILPESPVWLASQGDKEAYGASIDRMNWLAGFERYKKKKLGVQGKARVFFGRALLWKRLLCLFSLWFVTFYSIHALPLNVEWLLKFVEITPIGQIDALYSAQLMLWLLLGASKEMMDYLDPLPGMNRRRLHQIFQGAFVNGLLGALILLRHGLSDTLVFSITMLVVSIMAELCADICNLVAIELMPTEIRGLTTGVALMIGVAAMATAEVTSTVFDKGEPVYYMILIGLGVLMWIVSFFLLDETKNVNLRTVGKGIMASSRSAPLSSGVIKTTDERELLNPISSDLTGPHEAATPMWRMAARDHGTIYCGESRA